MSFASVQAVKSWEGSIGEESQTGTCRCIRERCGDPMRYETEGDHHWAQGRTGMFVSAVCAIVGGRGQNTGSLPSGHFSKQDERLGCALMDFAAASDQSCPQRLLGTWMWECTGLRSVLAHGGELLVDEALVEGDIHGRAKRVDGRVEPLIGRGGNLVRKNSRRGVWSIGSTGDRHCVGRRPVILVHVRWMWP